MKYTFPLSWLSSILWLIWAINYFHIHEQFEDNIAVVPNPCKSMSQLEPDLRLLPLSTSLILFCLLHWHKSTEKVLRFTLVYIIPWRPQDHLSLYEWTENCAQKDQFSHQRVNPFPVPVNLERRATASHTVSTAEKETEDLASLGIKGSLERCKNIPEHNPSYGNSPWLSH